ncbi:hypothetical protein VOLCADRAFT_106047 [Volvox carteri f. nagariensis]|uniref:Methionyl-tRNA formyltransferase, mitochondrial n=1 Tax=Volvox carteri f. nagariensis TaxID=3068 RepID=D8U4R4_VOLCA|nr:uncharacterized protein VOLCADRAFT_106047 [Volvox carteri f. nagariensis]EFJ45234.1 hypothetical protein VOLCADRAFT_106047 [Volvox carteri f. nagariensis]|eukprot:XP_002953610.1 hypothetical protein VOLCADRAFT_106047 [Volvox carteri f. nagariensis]
MEKALRSCSARPFTHSIRPVNPHRATQIVMQCTSPQNTQVAGRKHRVVFLGTPEVAAGVLQDLLSAAQKPDAAFEVALVVSQPGKPKGRGNRAVAIPSPVEALARDSGLLGPDQILCPARAREEDFLRRLEELQPDLAITAAYGNMLPQRFLDIPKYGTLNVHPSLLPKYRGAAPVQRALEDGVNETGVSVAYTVLACDAGPVLVQQRVPVDQDDTAPELLQRLFQLGGQLLLQRLPDVWAGRGPQIAVPQDESQVLHAAKLSRDESVLDFSSTQGHVLHNRVRAFAGWPGTSATFLLQDEASGETEAVDIKIVKTRASPPAAASEAAYSWSWPAPASGGAEGGSAAAVVFSGDSMLVPCAGGTWLEVWQVQPPTKKVMSVKDFRNGLRGKRLLLPPPRLPPTSPTTKPREPSAV